MIQTLSLEKTIRHFEVKQTLNVFNYILWISNILYKLLSTWVSNDTLLNNREFQPLFKYHQIHLIYFLQLRFSNFLVNEPLVTKFNFYSLPNELNIKLQNITNLPVFNRIYMRKESGNYKCRHLEFLNYFLIGRMGLVGTEVMNIR